MADEWWAEHCRSELAAMIQKQNVDLAAARAEIERLSERNRALEEAIDDADQTLMLLGDTGWRHRHRAALTSGGRG